MKNPNMNLDLKSLPKQFATLYGKIQRYSMIIFFVIIFGLYAYLVLQISSTAQSEPSDEEVTAQLSTVKRLKIDKEAITKIQQLQDQNVVVQSLFETARENPFSE